MKGLRIGDFQLDEKVLVIAEVGNNHEGDIGRAREMVLAAAESGADAVKFQTFRTEGFVSHADPRRFAQLQRFELSGDEFAELAQLARHQGLLFFSTPLDLESAALLEGLVDAIKVASGDNNFYPLIRRVAEGKHPLLLSSGMADLPALERAVAEVEDVRGAGAAARLAVLHCVSSYPAPDHDLNLRAIPLLAARLGHTIGYSDHALGNVAALAAVALGARIIEKHFTLAGIESDFRDHELSLTPDEMRSLVGGIRRTAEMLGEAVKHPVPAEEAIATVARRSIHAGRNLQPGDVVAEEDLVWLRPGGGLPPGEEERLVGHEMVAPVRAGELLLEEHVR